MQLDLADKVVLVSGSSRGIGKAIAAAFVREGARVMVSGRNADSVARTTSELSELANGKNAISFAGDLTDPEDINRCLDKLIGSWNQLDVVVANIGSGKGERGWQASAAEWERLIQVNLTSTMRLCRAAIPHLKRTRGNIVVVASIAGLEHLGAPAAYEVAKSAVISLGKYLSHELAQEGIRVNTVAPGNILFPGSVWEDKLQNNRTETMALIETTVPMKRFGSPEEIASAVLFLASKQASFITGACLVVDGGQTRSL